MGTATVGQLIVSAKIENVFDLHEASRGQLAADQVRRIEVADARVDTGMTSLSLPKRLIAQLGLNLLRSARAKTAARITTFGIFGPVRLAVQGRDCTVEVAELPEECPPLIGVIALEILDFVVNPRNQTLTGNPAHGGEQIYDMFYRFEITS
jgi:predicted aspartyl protease